VSGGEQQGKMAESAEVCMKKGGGLFWLPLTPGYTFLVLS
jgi:hypothetical protein